MAVTTPILAGTTLPNPSEFTISRNYRGTTTEMADGTVRIDLVSTTAKHVFTLAWTGLTSTQVGTVTTAFDAIKESYSASNFTAPNGTVYTVTRDSELSWDTFHSTGNLRYNSRNPLVLREV